MSYRETHERGRLAMREAFLAVSTLARHAGADEDKITQAHGLFFDGNVQVKAAFSAAVILAAIRDK